MSENTEQPTPKRIRDSGERGDICKGQDLAPAATILALAFYLIGNAESIFETLVEMFTVTLSCVDMPYEQALERVSSIVIEASFALVLPLVGLLMAVALIVLLAETGFLFAPKAAVPKLENISPSRWFKRVVSTRNLFEFIKNIVKVAILGAIVWTVFAKYVPMLFSVPKGGVGSMWMALGSAMGEFLLYTAGAFAAVAALDFLYQKYRWTQEHKMSIDEVKREYKDSEGDPLVKGKRKELYRELMNQNALASVRKAKVLIVNPTHYAVALDYDAEKTPLPVIVDKGEGVLAQRMIEEAKQAGVPIMRNVPLAQALYREGTENAYIPRDLIGPVAEVLRWVQGLAG